jgi:cytochrome c oxidase subunit 2
MPTRSRRRPVPLARTLSAVLILLALPVAARAPLPAERGFTVTATRYTFEPERFEATEGEHLRFAVTAADTDHGFEIKALDVEQLTPEDETTVVTIEPPPPGTYEIRCSEYCGRGHRRMKATLVVHPRPGS